MTAVVTAMTDAERPFLADTLKAIEADAAIQQVVLCVDACNTWIGNPPGVEVLRLPHMFVGGARNLGVSQARCEWIAFCDGDDVWVEGKTQKMLAAAHRTHADIVGACHYLTDVEGTVRANGFAVRVPMPSSWLVKRSVLEAVPFDESRSEREDLDWWRRTARYRKARCPARLLRYRVRPDSLSSIRSIKQRKERFVRMAQKPLLGPLLYFATWCRWASLLWHRRY